MSYKKGDSVWVRISWQDDDCWYGAKVIKETDKRVQVETLDIRPDAVNPFYSKNNVKLQSVQYQLSRRRKHEL